MNESLPDDLLDALTTSIDSLQKRLFAIDLNQGSKKDAYKSIDFLVDALCLWEQRKDKATLRDFTNLEYYFLKRVLEKNAPLLYQEQHLCGLLGIVRDRSPLTIHEQDRISLQVAAQVLWGEEGDSYLTITFLVKALRSKEHPLHALLKLNKFHDEQRFKKMVSPCFRYLQRIAKSIGAEILFLQKSCCLFQELALKKGINFVKLRFAARQITRILQSRGWPLSKALSSPYIQALEALLPETLHTYVREWATEPLE